MLVVERGLEVRSNKRSNNFFLWTTYSGILIGRGRGDHLVMGRQGWVLG